MNFLNSLDVTVNAFIIMWRCPLFCYSFVNQESLVNNTCWRKQKDHLCSFVFRRWDRRRRNSQHKQIRMFLVMFSVFGPVSFRRCFLCGYQSDPRPVPVSGSTLFEILLLTSRGLPTSIYGLRDAWIQSWPFIVDYINAASFMNSLIYMRFSWYGHK